MYEKIEWEMIVPNYFLHMEKSASYELIEWPIDKLNNI